MPCIGLWSDNLRGYFHQDVIKWKHFPRYWPFVKGINRSPVNSPHKGQWRGDLMLFICAQTNVWANHPDAGDLRRHRAQYDVTVMFLFIFRHMMYIIWKKKKWGRFMRIYKIFWLHLWGPYSGGFHSVPAKTTDKGAGVYRKRRNITRIDHKML